MQELIAQLKALAEDWRSRRYNHQYDNASAEQFARGEGKEDAYSDAADELLSTIARFEGEQA